MGHGISPAKRRRWILRHIPQHVRDADYTGSGTAPRATELPPSGHTPSLSEDAALTALAQLAAIRLGADRGLISLLDDECQYVLAESTPRTRLRVGDRQDAASQLWLGSAMVPRILLACAAALRDDLPDSKASGSIIVPDMSKDPRFETLSIVTGPPGFRFYAAAPISIQDGTIVGSICVYSVEARHDVPREDVALLEDIASTVIEHLAANELRRFHEQGERMTRGLIDFVAGADELQVHPEKKLVKETSEAVAQSTHRNHQRTELRRDSAQGPVSSPSLAAVHRSAAAKEGVNNQSRLRTSLQTAAVVENKKQLQNSVTPDTVRNMFSRAANIIRETSDLSGVIIFDTSVAALGDRGHIKPRSEAASASASSSDMDRSSEDFIGGKANHRMSQVLGFSLEYDETKADVIEEALQSLPERVLLSMLKRFPSGKVFNINYNGALSTSDESDSSGGHLAVSQPDGLPTVSAARAASSRVRQRSSRLQRIGEALQRIAPDALSIACLPLWDHDRSRWYAMALVWTKRIERTLTPENDLLYLRAFGNSIMMEVSRLDQMSANQTKSTFIASISHELRSPLHGILGGIEFLQDTDLDMFQRSMLHSISTCSHTLLDTLSHVLDFADVSQLDKRRQNPFQKKTVKSGATLQPVADVTAQSSMVDLGAATEQVVEAIFASQSYRVIQKASGLFSSVGGVTGATQWSASGFSGDANPRKLIRIVLNMSAQKNWKFNLSPGAWGRLVMNLLGNALKYTNSGYIKISLSVDPARKLPGRRGVPVYLSVSDTGVGMSKSFLQEKLFVPFSQEDALSTGIGLGMSIVRHLVDSMHGKIEVQSEPEIGTIVKVRVQLDQPKSLATMNDDNEIDSLHDIKEELRNRKICILNRKHEILPGNSVSTSGLATDEFVGALQGTLTEWLHMDVIISSEWYDHGAEVVILVEPSFEYLASIRSRKTLDQRCPITIFLAIDAIEAAALRADARVLSKESVVEICSQPCGPYKMAKLISQCLKSERAKDSTRTEQALTSLGFRTEVECTRSPEALVTSEATQDRDFSSNSENGTSLPLHLLEQQTSDKLPPKSNNDQPALTVLIVDDNSINRRMLIAFCKKFRFNYFEASDGLQALNEFKFRHNPDAVNFESQLSSDETRQRFDIVLMDLSMPIMDGMTATREMRTCEQEWQKSPCLTALESEQRVPQQDLAVYIVALTGLASPSARFEAIEAGVDLYMTKPVNFQSLQEVLDCYLLQRS